MYQRASWVSLATVSVLPVLEVVIIPNYGRTMYLVKVLLKAKSKRPSNVPTMAPTTRTTMVSLIVSSRLGQTHFLSSLTTSPTNRKKLNRRTSSEVGRRMVTPADGLL